MALAIAAVMSAPHGLLIHTIIVLPAWWMAALMSTVSYYALRQWAPALWVICVTGSLGQALVLRPYYRFV